PRNWAPSIVVGKRYDTAESSVGFGVWEEVKSRLIDPEIPVEIETEKLEEKSGKFSDSFLTRARLGQGAFRVVVTDIYRRRCAITGEKTLPVLEAAHIKPFADKGPHSIRNGLLLRSDFHTLFDR